MPTETKYMIAWISAAFLFIALIVVVWLWNSSRIQGNLAYGVPADSGTLESPHTPFIVVQNRAATDVPSISESLPDATRFSALLSSTGISALLKGKGPYTIFVPTDRALRQLPPNMLSSLTPAQLKRLVEYHVVMGRAIDVNAVDTGTVQALSGDTLNLSVQTGDQSARVNNSIVLEAFTTKNGIVYLVNAVLLPPIPANH